MTVIPDCQTELQIRNTVNKQWIPQCRNCYDFEYHPLSSKYITIYKTLQMSFLNFFIETYAIIEKKCKIKHVKF